MNELDRDHAAPSTAHEPPEQFFLRMLKDDRFFIQRCMQTGKAVFYPRALSPFCGGPLRWEEAGGAGTVYSTTAVKRRAERGGDYNIAIVELDEGVRLMSTVANVSPTDVHIGMRVHAQIEHSEGTSRVVFVPSKAITAAGKTA